MTIRSTRHIFTFLLATVMGAAGWTGITLAQGAPFPPAVVLTINSNRIQAESLVGQDVTRQVQALQAKFQDEIKKMQTTLQQEAQLLQAQRGSLPAAEFQRRGQALQQQSQEYKRQAQQKQADLQRTLRLAENEMDRSLRPIIRKIMTSKGANFVLDQSQIALANDSIDITASVVEELNKTLPTLTIDTGTSK